MGWLKAALVAGVLMAADMVTDDLIVMNAEARVGRPATPGSVAGVARRTTRRVIRRTTVYAATLPPNCQTVVIEGTTLNQCGGTYYQSSGTQYVVVEVE